MIHRNSFTIIFGHESWRQTAINYLFITCSFHAICNNEWKKNKFLTVVAGYFNFLYRRIQLNIPNAANPIILLRRRVSARELFYRAVMWSYIGHLEMKRSCLQPTEWVFQGITRLINILNRQSLLQEGHICTRRLSLFCLSRQQLKDYWHVTELWIAKSGT